MFKWVSLLVCVLPLMALAQTSKYQNIGRTATPQEIKAWDIDVRPDFKGLPKGQGAMHQRIYLFHVLIRKTKMWRTDTSGLQ